MPPNPLHNFPSYKAARLERELKHVVRDSALAGERLDAQEPTSALLDFPWSPPQGSEGMSTNLAYSSVERAFGSDYQPQGSALWQSRESQSSRRKSPNSRASPPRGSTIRLYPQEESRAWTRPQTAPVRETGSLLASGPPQSSDEKDEEIRPLQAEKLLAYSQNELISLVLREQELRISAEKRLKSLLKTHGQLLATSQQNLAANRRAPTPKVSGAVSVDPAWNSATKDIRAAVHRLSVQANSNMKGEVGSSSKQRPVTLRDLGINGEEDEEFTQFLQGFQRDIRKIGHPV